MNVVRTPFEVLFIANGVFPKPRLPDASFAAFLLRLRHLRFRQACLGLLTCELRFDLLQAERIPIITGRQLHDEMPMIGQQHVRHNRKRMLFLNGSDRVAKEGATMIGGQNRSSSVRNDGEVKRPTGHKVSPIVRHRFLKAG